MRAPNEIIGHSQCLGPPVAENQGTAAAQKEWEAKNPEPEDKGTGFGDDADLDSDQVWLVCWVLHSIVALTCELVVYVHSCR